MFQIEMIFGVPKELPSSFSINSTVKNAQLRRLKNRFETYQFPKALVPDFNQVRFDRAQGIALFTAPMFLSYYWE
jgi:hypothetical protein